MHDQIHLSADDKRHLLQMMISLIKADQLEHPHEWQYIREISQQLDYHQTETTTSELTVPKDEPSRMACFYYLLFLSKIDGNVSTAEENKLYEHALKLGLNELMARDFVDLLRDHQGRPVPPQKMIAVIRRYMS